MVVTRQIARGAQLASSTIGAPVHVHIRRVPYLLEPGYPDHWTFVETHQDRIARKFAATIGAKGKRTWNELDAKQRDDLLAFLQTRKNCGDNAKPGEGECFWCPQNPAVQQGAKGSLPSQIPSWWGGCDKEDQKPECAPMYTQCGGADGTPTCCQWPKYFECKANKDGYKLCSKKA